MYDYLFVMYTMLLNIYYVKITSLDNIIFSFRTIFGSCLAPIYRGLAEHPGKTIGMNADCGKFSKCVNTKACYGFPTML